MRSVGFGLVLGAILIGCATAPVITQSPEALVPSPVGTHLPTVPATISTTSSPPPRASLAARFECAGAPLPPGMTPAPQDYPAVIDQTGLVQGCLLTDSIEPLAGAISVSNPFEDDAIEVVWADGTCDDAIVFTFRAVEGAYELAGDRPTACAFDGEPLPVYITFIRPVSAEDVSATLDGAPAVTPK